MSLSNVGFPKGGVAQRPINVFGLKVGIVAQDGFARLAGREQPNNRTTGNRRPRLQGLPAPTAGSIMMRSNLIAEG